VFLEEDYARAQILEKRLPDVKRAHHINKWIVYDGQKWKTETDEQFWGELLESSMRRLAL